MQRGELGGKDTPAWNGGGVGQVAKCQWACHWSREESRARWPGESAAGSSLQGLGRTETCRCRVCVAAVCAKKNWLWFSRGCEAARPRGGVSQRRGIRHKCWRRQRQHRWQLSRVVRQPGGPIPTCACTLPSRQRWQLRAQLLEHSIGLVAGWARSVQSPRQSCSNAF